MPIEAKRKSTRKLKRFLAGALFRGDLTWPVSRMLSRSTATLRVRMYRQVPIKTVLQIERSTVI
jgi:hypothetical protein